VAIILVQVYAEGFVLGPNVTFVGAVAPKLPLKKRVAVAMVEGKIVLRAPLILREPALMLRAMQLGGAG